MSGSRWVIIPSWLSGSWRSFLYNSCVYSYHLFLTSSASVMSIPFLPLMCPFNAWNVPLVSLIFLKRSLVFHILLISSISLHWSLRKAFLCLLAILWNSAFKWVYLSFSPLSFASLLFSAICKASPDNYFAFFFLGDGFGHYLLNCSLISIWIIKLNYKKIILYLLRKFLKNVECLKAEFKAFKSFTIYYNFKSY